MKKIVAETAVDSFVKDGMTVGLGTGSTAYYAIKRIGELVSEGYDLTCVATSVQSEVLANSLGIKTVDLDVAEKVDVTIDGADEVDPGMQLIKGLGGALLREKIVAAATVKEIIMVDESKLVSKLGTVAPLPVEVLQYGHLHTRRALERQGCVAVLRMAGGVPFVTDSGNYIYDCRFEGIDRPYFLEMAIDSIPGVVENGLFLNTAYEVLVCDGKGSVSRMSESVSQSGGQREIRVF
ncbi:MAG: ribose-5-phosphate isomerase RpiA [Candidatus Methanomethylophilaceae archaeon]|nr:ribose-5-phosphate isomerase RpiA [Candidatus Methanomethylophilaceae archaeon]